MSNCMMHPTEANSVSLSTIGNVRLGSKADICIAPAYVRFTPESGHWSAYGREFAETKSEARRLRHHRLSFGFTNRQRLTPSAPPPGLVFKYAMATRTTGTAPPVCRQIPCRHVVPIAANQHCTAGITISSLTCGIVNIPRIDVMNARIHGYLACPLQRLRRCRRNVPHFPVRMEGREVQRHIGAEMIYYPGTLRINFVG